MIARPGFGLGLTALSGLAVGLGLSEPMPAFLVPLACVWAVGLPWARGLQARANTPALRLVVDAAWVGVAFAVVQVAALRLLSLPPGAVWGLSLVLGALGEAYCRRVGQSALSPMAVGERRGLLATVLVLVGAFAMWWAPLQRPLADFWWLSGVEEAEKVSVSAEGFEPVGWPEAGVVWRDVERDVSLVIEDSGSLAVLAQGDMGLDLRVMQQGVELGRAVLESDPTEQAEEGPVPRYLDRGVVGVLAPVALGPVTLEVSAPARVFLLPTSESAWSLHAAGDLRFVHYYQILNLVENQRWAAEMLEDRWGTVSQPPLWSNLLALQTLVDPDLPGASALFFWVLILVGLTALRLMERTGEAIPALAWFLPATAVVLHARLMIEPGSVNFPDTLYTASLLAGLLALRERRWAMFAALAVASSLLRYPGAFVLFGAAGLEAMWGRTPEWVAGIKRAAIGLFAALGLFVVTGLVVGQLGSWVTTISFEIGPEHWHGDYALSSLLPRAPTFFGMWLAYAGGLPLLVIMVCRGAALRLFGVAFAYSLLLCTIDHQPSHYFLPLLALTAISFGAGVGRLPDQRLANGLAGLAVLGMWITLGIVHV